MGIGPAGRPPGCSPPSPLRPAFAGDGAPLPRTRVPDRMAARGQRTLPSPRSAPARPPAAGTPGALAVSAMPNSPAQCAGNLTGAFPGTQIHPARALPSRVSSQPRSRPAASSSVCARRPRDQPSRATSKMQAGHNDDDADRPENSYLGDEPDDEENDTENDQGGLLAGVSRRPGDGGRMFWTLSSSNRIGCVAARQAGSLACR